MSAVMNDVVDLGSVIANVDLASEVLRSRAMREALRSISDEDAAALRRAILRLTAFIDDSISNPFLGSVFDRTTNDPLNSLADAIAGVYGVAKTYPGTTGTTGLNTPAVMTLAGEGESIAIARDCHVSVIGGLCLSGAVPIYLEPPFDAARGLMLPPTPGEVAALLDTNPAVRALVVTMPTYHGLMGDVAGIVDACHRRGVLVMVDEAHGSHFRFLRDAGFPICAEDAGADVITQSTHKVLAALNQASLLHFNNEGLVRRYEECQAMGFQSTSFSYPLLMSIEQAIAQMTEHGPRTWKSAIELAERLADGARRIPGVSVVDDGIIDGARVVGRDRTRVTVDVKGTGRSGYDVRDALARRGAIVEMATTDVVLFLVSPSVSAEQVDRTISDLEVVVARAPARRSGAVAPPERPALPEHVLSPRRATMSLRRRRVPRREAIGRICAETIGAYPPGQAIFVAGERIHEEGVDYLERVVASGGHLKRVQDDHFETIEVVE